MNRIGIHLYNRGPHARRALITDAARIADALPIDDVWVFDHVAIPPDQSQGSNGHYVERWRRSPTSPARRRASASAPAC